MRRFALLLPLLLACSGPGVPEWLRDPKHPAPAPRWDPTTPTENQHRFLARVRDAGGDAS
jgi:hypothetical protein